jgi:hypothetical protein
MNRLATSRRRILQGLALGAGAAALGSAFSRQGRAETPHDPRFLIVLSATGGASIVDGPLAVRASESSDARSINCFPDSSVVGFEGTDLRAVRYQAPSLGPIPYAVAADQAEFVRKHRHDMLVVTATTTSVNHALAQRRSVTGNEAWNGRTLQEAVALQHGRNALVPNAHLLAGTSYTERGNDPSLPAACYGESVIDPLLWPLALHGSRGTPAGDRPDLVGRARALRDGRLQAASPFSRAFGGGAALSRWRELRGPAQADYEQADLIKKLMLAPDGDRFALNAHGLAASPDADRVREKFPFYEFDPLDAQAAMAFLLLKHRVSVAVTLGVNFNFVYDPNLPPTGDGLPPDSVKNPPLGFDFSHTSHRAAQALMWQRIYRAADGLIDLLKSEEFAPGESFWSRSLIYVATDFGRTKRRPEGAEEFGSGHDLNNGFVVFSPLVPGGRVLGGVDPATALTYGFDPDSGAPDRHRQTSEREVYAGLLHALGVDTSGSGLPDMRAMRRAG